MNRCHKQANLWYPRLREIWEPLVGTKILKADGHTFLQKYANLMPALPTGHGAKSAMVYRHTSEYNLAWCVKVCEQCIGTEHCLYYEVTIYIGGMSNGVLTDVIDNEDRRCDYTEGWLLDKRRVFAEAETALNEAKSALFPFGERYDN